MPTKDWDYYVAESPLYHALKVKELGKEHRLISLCLHPPEPDDSAVRYTAVWAKVQGPPWDMLSLGSDKELLSFLEKAKAKSYYPRIVTGCQSDEAGAEPLFAAVVSQGPVSRLLWPPPPTEGLGFVCDALRSLKQYPRWIALYGGDLGLDLGGSFSDQPCLIVSEENPSRVHFNLLALRDKQLKPALQALEQGFGRIDNVALAGPHSIYQAKKQNKHGAGRLVLCRDDVLEGGSQTLLVYGKNQVESTINALKATVAPVRIQGEGVAGSQARFAIVVAQSPKPSVKPRSLRIHYRTLNKAFKKQPLTSTTSGEFKALDDYVVGLMKDVGARAAQLAVAFEGKLKHAAAFTWAESDYPDTKHEMRMRVGSISKVITCMAAMLLEEEKGIKLFEPSAEWNAGAVPWLLARPFADPRYSTRFMGHLMAHLGNFVPDSGFPVYYPPFKEGPGFESLLTPGKVASALGLGSSLDVKAKHYIDYLAKLPPPMAAGDPDFFVEKLPTPPGPESEPQYSGLGIFILGEIIATMRLGKGPLGESPYLDAVTKKDGYSLFSRAQLSSQSTQITNTEVSKISKAEVRYHPRAPSVGWSAFDGSVKPSQYDPLLVERSRANGFWSMPMYELAWLLSSFDRSEKAFFKDAETANEFLAIRAQNRSLGFYHLEHLKIWIEPSGQGPIDPSGPAGGPDTPGLPSLKQELHDVAYHAGETAGAAAVACRRADGLVIALALNTEFLGYAGLPDDKEVAASMLGAADHLIGYWPTDVNLFPSFGKGKKPEKKKAGKK